MFSISKTLSRPGYRFASSFVKKFQQDVISMPHRNAVVYTSGPDLWTMDDIGGTSYALATGLYEKNLRPGDVVLFWIKESSCKHASLLACAQLGIHAVEMDNDANYDVNEMRSILKKVNPSVFIIDSATEACDRLKLLRKTIPELFYYEGKCGQTFHSKHFPALKYVAHSDPSHEVGFIEVEQFVDPDDQRFARSNIIESLTDATPFYSKVVKAQNEFQITKPITHGEIISSKCCPVLGNIVEGIYTEVDDWTEADL